MNKFKKAGSVLLLVGSSSCLSAGELPWQENMQGLQFNFSTPGARSLAMGGAFIGRADDATAAMANPAGLTNLSVPEISLEYRHLEYKTVHATSGTWPDQIGERSAKSSADNLSYISYVKPGDKFTWAVFRHELMDFNTKFDTGEIDLVNPDTQGEFTTFPTSNKVDSSIATYGFSGAFRLGDRFSLGASVQYFDFSMNGALLRFADDSRLLLQNQSYQKGSDNGWGITLGGLLRFSDRLSMGFIYRNTPEFNVNHTFQNGQGITEYERGFKFDVPEVFGVGFSFQASDNFTVNFDVNRVSYSDLAKQTFNPFGPEEFPEGQQTAISDGTELRLGFEYLLSNKPIALRAGVWQEPGHSLEYRGGTDSLFGRISDSFYVGTDDETHYSLGMGIFKERFSLDFAADFSDVQDTYSVSGVFYF